MGEKNSCARGGQSTYACVCAERNTCACVCGSLGREISGMLAIIFVVGEALGGTQSALSVVRNFQITKTDSFGGEKQSEKVRGEELS